LQQIIFEGLKFPLGFFQARLGIGDLLSGDRDRGLNGV